MGLGEDPDSGLIGLARSARPYRWFTVAEVAEALNVTDACVRRWCRLGVIASLRIGKYRRIASAEIERLARESTLPSTTYRWMSRG